MAGVNFCHIAPTSYLDYVKKYPVHLLLAHLIEEDEQYRNFYINLKKDNPEVFYHMDNSAFEMFKRGTSMYPSDKLIDMAKLVGADSIVMSDYPKEHYTKTIDQAVRQIPTIKAAGFKTFFCPQSELSHIGGLLRSFEWALNNVDIDFIGVSILACPIALGVNEQKHDADTPRDDAYRMQRYLSRWKVLRLLEKNGMLDAKAVKRFHCLGLTDGPNEIDLLAPYHHFIYSWDSSSAIWHGINGISYDMSPTGLSGGKFEKEVDFSIEKTDNHWQHIVDNISYVNGLCKKEKTYEL